MSDNCTEIDCLFIHVMKKTKGNENCRFLARGPIAFADLLEKNGISSEIIHLDIEKSRNCNFNIVEYIKNRRVKILGISIHWNHQLFSALEVIRRVKKEMEDINIVIGGFSATFFAKEIMENFKEVDFLIRGDAEIPLLILAKSILNKQKNYSSIPNLLWRHENKIKENKWTYVASQKDLNKLSFSNFSLLKNFEYYLRGYFNKGILGDIRNFLRYLIYGKIFYLITGRGCFSNCSYCGGSKFSQCIINKRKHVIWKSHNSIIKDLKNLKKYDVDTLWIVFDTVLDKNYYKKLFRMMRNEKLRFRGVFECYSTPSKEFIDEFRLTFEKNSMIILSPESSSEKIRKLNKGFFYTNKNLINILEYIKTVGGIKVKLCFTLGLPFQRKTDIYETIKFCKFVLKKYRNVFIQFSSIEIDPASPIYLNPSKYGVKLKRFNFFDFYKYSQKSEYNVGYSTNYFSERDIVKNTELINNFFIKLQSIRLISIILDKIYGNIKIRLSTFFMI